MATTQRRCCQVVYWKHEDGWDVYLMSDCYKLKGKWIPAWYDGAIIEDAPTKRDAIREIEERHPLGICLVRV